MPPVDTSQVLPAEPVLSSAKRRWVPVAERTADVLRVARELFLRDGYERVTVSAVIAAAGGSKRDFYAEFGDKEALFRRVVAATCFEANEPMRYLAVTAGGAAAALTRLGTQYLSLLLSPLVLALHRILVAESRFFPELAQDWLLQGPSECYRLGGEVIATLAGAGELTAIEDPREAAVLFLDMITGDIQLRALAGVAIGPREVETRVQAAVRTFLRGAGPASGADRSDEFAPGGGTKDRRANLDHDA